MVEDTLVTTSEAIADYRLIDVIGRGPGARVHLAHPPDRLGPGTGPVAVKVLEGTYPRDRLSDACNRLVRAAQLGSVRLIEVYEVGRAGATVWFSMAHHPDGSLANPSRPLDRAARISAVADAAAGAHVLHEAGLAHGNIKPGNILLAPEGACLADIDLQASLAPGRTLPATPLLADVEFTDPAVIRGHPPGRSSDIWALGMTLHRVLTGDPVCRPGPDDDTVSAIARLSTFRLEIADSLTGPERNLVQACLAAGQGDRPATADDVARALREVL